MIGVYGAAARLSEHSLCFHVFGLGVDVLEHREGCGSERACMTMTSNGRDAARILLLVINDYRSCSKFGLSMVPASLRHSLGHA